MSTWISKSLFAALGLILAGCDDGPALLQEQVVSRRMTEVDLAGGQIVLSAPKGYCVDKRSVRRSSSAGFALLARCDTLGVTGFFAAQELALITVTTAPRDPNAAAPTISDLVAAAAPLKVVGKSHAEGLPVIRIGTEEGITDGLSPNYWRGAFAVNGQLVGLALYAPETRPELGAEGAMILGELANRTRQASAARAAETPPKEAATSPQDAENKSPVKLITGLFE